MITIIEECAQNKERSQRIIYDRYLGIALKTAFRYVNSYDNAAHAANDAFIKIFKAFKTFEIRDVKNVEPMLVAWIKKIVINAAIDYMQRENAIPYSLGISEDARMMTDRTANGENNMVYKELICLVRSLSPAYRAVFNLHVIDGYSHPEIAKMLGITIGTSKSNLSKARACLQKYLAKEDKRSALCLT